MFHCLTFSCRCSTLHVSAYMAIFKCVWCFPFIFQKKSASLFLLPFLARGYTSMSTLLISADCRSRGVDRAKMRPSLDKLSLGGGVRIVTTGSMLEGVCTNRPSKPFSLSYRLFQCTPFACDFNLFLLYSRISIDRLTNCVERFNTPHTKHIPRKHTVIHFEALYWKSLESSAIV
jgi:hypothetical protein